MVSLFEKILGFVIRLPLRMIEVIFSGFPFFKFIRETRNTQVPITFKMWWIQKIKGINRDCYWPVHPSSLVFGSKNIFIGVETSPGYMPGCYLQGLGKIFIGDYTQIASNVGIISSNHDVYDNRTHILESVTIGKYCWIGTGSTILPGVELGDFTIVGAGSIVTKSFPEGYIVIAGNPAKIVRYLDKEKCRRHKSTYEYHGYVPAAEFESFRRKYLKV